MSDPALPDADFLAAEYALGVLGAAERRSAERRIRRDAAFAAEVDAWQGRLGPLAAAVAPVPVPAHVWRAVETEIRVPSAPAAPPRADPGRRVAAFWRWLAIGSMSLAAASLAALVVVANPVALPERPALAASIAADGGVPLFAAVIDPGGGSATLVPIRVEMASGRVPELWLIPAGGAPLSLGVIDPAKPLRIALRPGMAEGGLITGAGAALAVSLEPEGGSPTGQPTGPVVGHGALQAI